MKPNKRTTKIALLREAKQVLRAKRRLHICLALHDASKGLREQYPGAYYAFAELCMWTQRSLQGYTTYEGWLVNLHGALPRDVHTTRKNVVRQRRLDWIDWMINELEEGRDLK